jgi:hypothetical protein
MEIITGPISYQKIILSGDRYNSGEPLYKIIHLFGDKHVIMDQSKEKIVLLESVLEETIQSTSEKTDIYLETGFGSALLRYRELHHQSEQTETMYLHELQVLSNSYLQSFENYFITKADCFMKPRKYTSKIQYPNTHFHSIDLRDTLENHCISIINPICIRLHLFEYYSGTMIENIDELYERYKSWISIIQHEMRSWIHTHQHDPTLEKELFLHIWLHTMITLRGKRIQYLYNINAIHRRDLLYPIGIFVNYSFLFDVAEVILHPTPDSSIIDILSKEMVDKYVPYEQYILSSKIKKINHPIQFIIFELYKKKIDDIKNKYYFYKLPLRSLASIFDITSWLMEFYMLCRLMKQDHNRIMIYIGNSHTASLIDLLKNISLCISYSPLYTNQGKQCIKIPYPLTFTDELYKDIGSDHVESIRATSLTLKKYPSSYLQFLRNECIV